MRSDNLSYEVSADVELSVEEATFLKLIATHHYDYKVKESAARGPINGLFNCANWRAEDAEAGPPEDAHWLAVHPRDIDTMLKALEQWRLAAWHGAYSEDVALRLKLSLTLGLRDAMDRCYRRKQELNREGCASGASAGTI